MAGPKVKPHKGLLKRVKVTATGKIIRRKSNKSHLMSHKPSKRRRRLGRPAEVAAVDRQKISRLLGKA